MALKQQTLAEALRDITSAAPGLRRAGVMRVSVGDISVDLATPPPNLDGSADPPPPEPEIGSLDDAFGRRMPGGVS